MLRNILAVLGLAIWSFAALAQGSTEIVVYTSYENEDLVPYKTAFEKATPGVTIRWVRDSTGVIAARLIAERSNPRADAIWGVAATSMGILEDADVLLPYAPPGLDKIPAKFRDRRNPPYWYGNSAWVAAIVYNEVEGKKRNIPKPTSWQDLTNPVYRGTIVMPHPVSSGTGFLDVSAWLQAFGEEKGWAYMDALHANIWRYTHSGSTPATLAGAGEAVIGIAFDLRGAREKDRGAPLDIIFPKEGLGWEMNAFALVKGAPRLEAAKKLADWAATTDAMRMYGETRAVSAMPELGKPVAHLPTDLPQRIMENDFAWASKHRERILAEWVKRYEAKADPKR